MNTQLMKKIDEKNYHVVCPMCGTESDLHESHMVCTNPDCGYLIRPNDALTMNLFERVKQVAMTPLRLLVAPVGVLPRDQMAIHVVDVSKWQYLWDGSKYILPDFDKMKNETDMIYVIHKASQGVWADPTWEMGVDALLHLQVAIGAYHFADVSRGAIESAETFAAQVNEIPDENQWGTWEFPQYWLDAETNRGSGTNALTPHQMAVWIKTFLDKFKELCPQPIGIYSREIWWNDYVERNDWAHNYAFWCARYNTWIYESGEPIDWSIYGKKSLLWQYSADGNGFGYEYGVYSNSIDLNRCQLYTRDQVFDIAYPPVVPNPDCCDNLWSYVNEKVAEMTAQIDKLNSDVASLSSDLIKADEKIDELSTRIETHTHDDGENSEYLTVIVDNDENKNCSVYAVTYYDEACSDAPPGYDGPKGKPIPETKVGAIEHGKTFLIFASGYESCIDDFTTPEIITGHGDYYRVYGGVFDRKLIPAKRVTIIKNL